MMQEKVSDIIQVERMLPTIGTLYKNEKEQPHYCRFMAYFVQMLNEAFNLNDGKLISPMQAEMIIHTTHTQFPWFRINDVFKVVQSLITGEYKIEHRLDPPIWFAACRQYDIKRSKEQSQYLEKYNHNIKFEMKELNYEPIKWKDKDGIEHSAIEILKPFASKEKPKRGRQPHWSQRLKEHTLVANEMVNKMGYHGTYRQAATEFHYLRKGCLKLRDKKRETGRVYKGIRAFAVWLDDVLKEVDNNVKWK
jgi:hypothetical protein